MQKHHRKTDIKLTDREINYKGPSSDSLNNETAGEQANMSNGVYGQAAMLAYQIRQIAFITDAPQMIPFWNPWVR